MSDFPRSFDKRLLVVPLFFILLGLVQIPLQPVAWDTIYHTIRELPIKDQLASANHFATEATVLFIAWAIWVLDPRRRQAIGVLLVAIALNSLVIESTKQITGRARPMYGLKMGGEEAAWINAYLAEHPEAIMVPHRQDQWMFFSPQRPFFNDDYASFPSGHAGGAFVLATFLAILYPRGRVLWFLIAAMCAIARVEKRRHYPEDVMIGGAIGFLVMSFVAASPWAAAVGARAEVWAYAAGRFIHGKPAGPGRAEQPAIEGISNPEEAPAPGHPVPPSRRKLAGA